MINNSSYLSLNQLQIENIENNYYLTIYFK